MSDRRPESVYDLIYYLVGRIPKGRVATYGQIASLAGIPRQPRRIGYALGQLPKNTRIPWHRVINMKGEISLRADSGPEEIQRMLLRKEGIHFDKSGRVPLDRFQWRPRS